MDLFSATQKSKAKSPLADRMRPETFDEFVGQDEIVGHGKPLRQMIDSGNLPSIILWGPPGSGKTTLASLMAKTANHEFIAFSAVTSGIKDIQSVIETAKLNLHSKGRKTILFVDEFHRFNRTQQDAFLPHIENGTIVLIGATTENPSFEINSALLSRCRVYTLEMLSPDEIHTILERAINDQARGLGSLQLKCENGVLDFITDLANGDARIGLNLLEMSASSAKPVKGSRTISVAHAKEIAQKRTLRYDSNREEHYNVISAFIKSIRGSDPDSALYWLARMLEGGEDPLFIARRLVILASEDIGNADPHALVIAVAAKDGVDLVGMPEARLILAQATTYLATAPKSNASTIAISEAMKDAKDQGNLPVPLHLRNAPTKLMKDIGYGKGYQYSHDYPDAVDTQDYMPEDLKSKRYYKPKEIGFEKEIQNRMNTRQKKRNFKS